jgi:hypothetical protein
VTLFRASNGHTYVNLKSVDAIKVERDPASQDYVVRAYVGANTFDVYRRGTEGEAMDEAKYLAEHCEEAVEHGLPKVD